MKKKYIAIIFMVFFIGAMSYNIYLFDLKKSIVGSDNLPSIIGIGASLCGFLLGLMAFRFYQIKEKLDKEKSNRIEKSL